MKKRSTIEEALLAANLGKYINTESKSEIQLNKPKVIIHKEKKKTEKKERRPRWEYEVPNLELDYLYKRVREIKEHHQMKFRRETAKQESIKKIQRENKGSDQNLSSDEMPEDLKDYTVRAFGKCKGKKKYENEMSGKLHKMIVELKKNLMIRRIDWNNHPLPLLSYEKLKKANMVFSDSFRKKGKNKKVYEDLSLFNKGINPSIKKKKKKSNTYKLTAEDEDILRKMVKGRRKRFVISDPVKKRYDGHNILNILKGSININDQNAVMQLSKKLKIVGTSQSLEKKYYRLTELPDPSTVRPERVLKRSLKHVLGKYRRKEADQRFVLDQLRSIRSDLNIQRIKNEFTVKVYEENALFSLEAGDPDQFNKCQMQLYDLYKNGLRGRKCEFLMYRILYLILNSEKNVLSKYLKEQDLRDLNTKEVSSALQLKRHLTQGNYMYVLGLLQNGLQGTKYLLKLFLVKLRVWALQIMSKSFGKELKIVYLQKILKFSTYSDCLEFLEELKLTLNKETKVLMLKHSRKELMSNPKMREGFN